VKKQIGRKKKKLLIGGKRRGGAIHDSEEQYRMLFEYVGDAILVSDIRGHYVAVNDQATKLTGYSRDELLTMTVGDLVMGDKRDLLAGYKKFHRDMRVRRTFHDADRQMRRKDGSLIWYEVNAVYLPNDTLLALIRDVTERKRVEEELQESEKRYRILFEQAIVAI